MICRPLAIFVMTIWIGLLTGCASVPKEAGFPDVQKRIEQRISQKVHWNQGTPEDANVADAIRSMLQQELTLDEAVQIALFNNRSLQAIYEELGIAQADVIQAGLLRNPVFFASFRFMDRAVEGRRGTNTEFSVDQDFFDLIMLSLRRRVATAQFEQEKLRVSNAVLDLASEVRSAYYTLQANEQTLEMRLTVAQVTEAAAEIARRQYEAGTLKLIDLINQQGFHAQAKIDVARADAQIIAGRERLNRLMGLWGTDITWKILKRLPELPKTEIPLEHLESKAISQRIDLAALHKKTEAIAFALSLTRRYRYFNVFEVGVDTEYDVPENVNLTGPHLMIELPIFDQRQAAIARLEAQLQQSQQQFSALAVDIRSEIREIRDRLQVIRTIVKYYQEVVLSLRQRIVEESQLYYNGMLIGVYELLLAKQNQINAGREYIEALRDYWITKSDLEHAAGGRLIVTEEFTQPYPQPMEQPITQPPEPSQYIHDH